MQRLQNCLLPAFQSQQYRNGQAWVTRTLFWQGGIARGNGANRLNISIGYYNVTNQSEHLELSINGTLVVTGPTWTPGQSGNYLMQYDLSGYGDQVNLDIKLEQVVVTANAGGVAAHPSRYLIQDVYTDRSSYPYATLVALSSPRESLTWTTLQTRLNAIGTVLTNAYGRITGVTDVFDRNRLYRWRPVLDDGQKAYFKDLYVARMRRAGDAFWVRGKGLQLGWGAKKVKSNLDEAYEYEFASTQETNGGDTITDKLLYFDAFPGLYGGMDALVQGEDCRGVFEQVR